jgi:predicted TIM-barrel fold metal-dependent hydrolase
MAAASSSNQSASSSPVKSSGASGTKHSHVVPPPRCIIDSHMHIMSGNCTPLPLLWRSIGIHFDRWTINYVLPVAIDAGFVGFGVNKIKSATEEISKLIPFASAIGTKTTQKIGLLVTASAKAVIFALYGVEKLQTTTIHLEAETLTLLLDAYAAEIQGGADILNDANAITQRVMSQIETARAKVKGQAGSAVEYLEEFSLINEAQRAILEESINLAMGTLKKMIESSQDVSQKVADAASSAASLAQSVSNKIQDLAGKFVSDYDAVADFVSNKAKQIVQFASYKLLDVVHGSNQAQVHSSAKLAKAFEGISNTINLGKLSKTTETQKKSTFQIGVMAIAENAEAFSNENCLLSPLIALPMDMEYAHLDGYKGKPIYSTASVRYYYQIRDQETNQTVSVNLPPDYKPPAADGSVKSEPGTFYYRYDRKSADGEGVPQWMPDNEAKMFARWPKQVRETVAVAKAKPWKILPLYHYEPRRWLRNGNWDDPFYCNVMDSKSNGDKKDAYSDSCLFIGFKMYPSLGYKPWDVMKLPNLAKFYARCASNSIPIVSHCSPGGLFTHERELYLKYNIRNGEPQLEHLYKNKRDGISADLQYFLENHTAPKNWDSVLGNNNGLKLCLAHFGGAGDAAEDKAYSGWQDVENRLGNWRDDLIALMKKHTTLYVDLAYFLLEGLTDKLVKILTDNPWLKERILFGTDWYMIMLDSHSYKSFCKRNKDFIFEIDGKLSKQNSDEVSLWTRFSMVNPFKFYGFDKMAEKYDAALNSLGAPDTDRVSGRKRMDAVAKQIKNLENQGRLKT